MRKIVSIASLLIIPTLVLAAVGVGTEPIECSDVPLGKDLSHKTLIVSSQRKASRAYASVSVHRDSLDSKGNSCLVVYKLFISRNGEPFRIAKSFSEKSDFLVGVDLVGFSPDESIVAANFWWAAGDYTLIRPVIYDFTSETAFYRNLENKILKLLPSCDYFQSFESVTNLGEAIIHVPKSIYVDKGCGDQGRWSFNVRSGKVHRWK